MGNYHDQYTQDPYYFGFLIEEAERNLGVIQNDRKNAWKAATIGRGASFGNDLNCRERRPWRSAFARQRGMPQRAFPTEKSLSPGKAV